MLNSAPRAMDKDTQIEIKAKVFNIKNSFFNTSMQ
jgi:hypothetical protein